MEPPVVSSELDNVISQVDVAFVIDTTGSMSAYIAEAQKRVREIAEAEAAKGLDLRLALVEYRDHPPEDNTFVVRTYPFSDIAGWQIAVNGLRANGGGDTPEAVWDGLLAASILPWREQADKRCFLVGDSPPHGYMADTRWAEGCPCRATPNGIVEVFGAKGITLHAISIAGCAETTRVFREVAEPTGGNVEEVESAVRMSASVGVSMHRTGEMVLASTEYSRAYMVASTAAPAASNLELRTSASASLGWTTEMAEGVEEYLTKRKIDWRKR